MQLHELEIGPEYEHQSVGKDNQLKLSDFLQYPTLDDPETDGDDIELRTLVVPETHPKAAELIARLVEATGTIECLEVLHDAYQMYCNGELIIDFEAGGWPDFWQVVFSEFDPATVALDQTSVTYHAY